MVIQHHCEAALGLGPSLAGQLSSFIFASALARHHLCFSSSWGNMLHFLQKGKVCSQTQWGADLYRQEALPIALDWSNLVQMRTPNLCYSIGPKVTLLIGQVAVTLICQWRCWWQFSCTALTGWGKPQVLPFEIGFQDLLYKAGLAIQRRGRLLPGSAICAGGPCVEMAAKLCFLYLSPVSY